MVPELYRTGPESAPLVETLCGEVPALRHHRHLGSLVPGEPALSRAHQLRRQPAPRARGSTPSSPIWPCPGFGTTQEMNPAGPPSHSPPAPPAPPTAALLDPRLVQLLATLDRKAAIVMEPGLVVAHPGDRLERRDILLARRPDRGTILLRGGARHVALQRHPNVNQPEPVVLSQADRLDIVGVGQEIQALDPACLAHARISRPCPP